MSKNFLNLHGLSTFLNQLKLLFDSKPEEITYSEWRSLTDAQRDGRHFKITGAPTSALTASIVSYDNTNSGLSATDAQEAIDELAQGGGGGHTILDPDGTSMTQQPNMQFADAHVTNDSVGEATIVENIKEHTTKADYDNATEDGFHVIDDGNDVPIGEIEKDYVEVTADGNKTYATLLDELYALIDSTKLTNNSYIDIFDGYFRLNDISGGFYYFERAFSGAKLFDDTLQVSSSGSLIRSWETTTNGNTYSDSTSTQKPTNGTKITLHYGNKKATVDLQTTANRCLRPNGETVEETFNDMANLKLVGLAYSDFTWNSGSKTFELANVSIPTGYSVAGFIINPTNVNAVFGGRYNSNTQKVSIGGWISSIGTSIDNSVVFNCQMVLVKS